MYEEVKIEPNKLKFNNPQHRVKYKKVDKIIKIQDSDM